MSEQLTKTPQRLHLKTYLADDKVKAKFAEILKDRTPQFLSALVQVGASDSLRGCSAQSIAASAMTAATLDLAIQPGLGLAWLVPYKGDCVFQIGWRGMVQLALRSGQFHRINACVVNADAFAGFDEIGEPSIDWSKLDETKEAVGYCVAWRLVNGFTKVAYWSKAKVIAHAQKFSQAYRGGRNTPWKTDFDAMALKTVVKNELGRWAPLSVQMQDAFSKDLTRRQSIDAEPEMIDLDPAGHRIEHEDDKPEFATETAQDAPEAGSVQPAEASGEAQAQAASEQERGPVPRDELRDRCDEAGVKLQAIISHGLSLKLLPLKGAPKTWADFPNDAAEALLADWQNVQQALCQS